MDSRRVRAAAVAFALAASACGGNGEVSTEGFIAEANNICEERRGTIEEAASQVLAGGDLPDPEELGRLAQETIVPELRAQFEELSALEPPEDVADEFEAFVSEGEQVVEQISNDPSVITDPANFESVNQQAEQVGLSDACRVGPG